MASVSHQALLMVGTGSVGIAGWHFPLSVVRDTPRRPVATFNADGAWLSALAFAGSGVKGVQWQQPLSAPKYPSRAKPPQNADGGWIIPKAPAAVGGGVTWQQPLSGLTRSIAFKAPSIIDPSSYAQAWLSAAAFGSPPLDGLTPTGAWSPSRKLLTSYGGSFYNLTTGKVDTLYDQSGNSMNMTQGTAISRPVVDNSTSVTALNFNGSNQLTKASAPSSFITATTGYMIATVKIASFITDNPVQPYFNAYVIQDSSQNCGITFSNNSGSPLYYVGSDPNYLSKSIVAATVYVIEWRHEGGILYQRTNGIGETSTAAGNTNLSATSTRMGGSFDGLIFEVVTFSSVPTLAQRNALVQALGSYVGASV